MKQRKDVYTLIKDDNDKTLERYAKAIAEMKTRPATDPTSWSYQAAMHGFSAHNPFWRNVGTVPSASEQQKYWNQCQHSSWFFIPWHRMYIAYFEQIVAQTLVDLGEISDIDDWALPFWNYSNTENPTALSIPAPFTTPADSTNQLWIKNRVNDTLETDDVNLTSLNEIIFTNLDGLRAKFGGGIDGPIQFGNTAGQLEQLPHNAVHSDIGGAMGNPLTAALDPIFWLHHANIDRLWQVWLDLGKGRANPIKSDWLQQSFLFHSANGQEAEFKVEQVLDTTNVLTGYTYQASNSPVPPPTLRPLKRTDNKLEIVAASGTRLPIADAENSISLAIPNDISARRVSELAPMPASFMSTAKSLMSESTDDEHLSTEAFLYLENITGKGAPPLYKVFVSSATQNEEEIHAGTISLFGLESASTPSVHHAGNGLNIALEISHIYDHLRKQKNWDGQTLAVRIVPVKKTTEDCDIHIGRISLHC